MEQDESVADQSLLERLQNAHEQPREIAPPRGTESSLSASALMSAGASLLGSMGNVEVYSVGAPMPRCWA